MFMAKKLGPIIYQAAKNQAAKSMVPRATTVAPQSAPTGFKAMSETVPRIAATAAKALAGRRMMKSGGKAKKINY